MRRGKQPSAPRSLCASLYLPRSPSSLPFPSAAFYAARPRLQGPGIFPGFPSWGLAALILGTSQFCFLAAQLRNALVQGGKPGPSPPPLPSLCLRAPSSCTEVLGNMNKPLFKAGALGEVQDGDLPSRPSTAPW